MTAQENQISEGLFIIDNFATLKLQSGLWIALGRSEKTPFQGYSDFGLVCHCNPHYNWKVKVHGEM